ncbi:unnamed protein product [Cochlearia groenlandica]
MDEENMIRVRFPPLIVHRNCSGRSSPNDGNTFRAPGSMCATRQDLTAWHKRLCESTWIVVKGYDTCLAQDDVKRALWNHFSSCGEIILVTVNKQRLGTYECSDDRPLCSTGSINIAGDVSKEKLMALSGRDTEGGWTVVVASVRPPKEQVINKVVHTRATISGFDTSLNDDEIKNALREHFSQCGEIITQGVLISRSIGSAFTSISGVDATAEKIMKLNGSFMGGFQISVEAYAPVTTGLIRYTRPGPPLSVLLAGNQQLNNKSLVCYISSFPINSHLCFRCFLQRQEYEDDDGEVCQEGEEDYGKISEEEEEDYGQV